MADDLTAAFLFLVIVAVIIAVGVLVGIIVAGRIDRLMAPKPRPAADEAPATTPEEQP